MVYIILKHYKQNKKENEKNITCVILLTEPMTEFRGIEISVMRDLAMHEYELRKLHLDERVVVVNC